MRAVNLLPPDLRRAATKTVSAARPEKVEGIGAYVVLGALALCIAALAAYVVTGNTVKQKQTDLTAAQAEATAVAAKAAALKPYADFEAVAAARTETVRGLAAARFDWEQALRHLARAVPSDVKLQTLNGDMGLPGSQGAGDPLRGSIQAPAITLAGCAASQVSVARLMARVKAVDGVTRVSLSKSEKPTGSSSTESPCPGAEPPSFSLVIFFEGSASAAELAPADASASSPVPVPNALNEATPVSTAGDATTPAADGSQTGTSADGTETPQASTADGATPAADPTTTTTTGGTP
jgi:Tfp pilus assembly protein PilN